LPIAGKETDEETNMDAIEKRTMDKVTWRLVPFYFIAYLDRVNVGFVNASMSKDLGLGAAAFGGAAGIFFIAYFFFEVARNLALNRFGARLWTARIVFTWGPAAPFSGHPSLWLSF
jgi:hypothetical protein